MQPIVTYILMILTYIILCSFFLNTNIEVLMFVLMFLFTLVSGYKVVYDLYKNEMVFNLQILLQKFGADKIVMSPVILLFLIVWLFISTFLYIASKSSINWVMGSVVSLTIFYLMNMYPNNKLSLYMLYSVPLFMLIMSTIMAMVAASILNGTVVSNKMDLSEKYRNKIMEYKRLYVSAIFILIIALVILSATNKDKYELAYNLIIAISLAISYLLSFFAFSDIYDVYNYVQFDMKTSDSYTGDFTAS